MNELQKFKTWHKSRVGHAVFAVLELGLAYGVGSRAIDTGSWWEYGLTLLLSIGGVQNLIRLIRKK
jgi:hypothetical protein